MVRTSLSEIITSSSNLQTNMLLLLVGHLGYPEVLAIENHKVSVEFHASETDVTSPRSCAGDFGVVGNTDRGVGWG
jgi:hypothetical protein